MSFNEQNGPLRGANKGRAVVGSSIEAGFADLVAPVIAGAQARGMADMLELLNYGAILIASDGAVLFASERAKKLTDEAICIVAGHLKGQTPEIRAMLDTMVGNVLAGKACREVIATPSRAIELRALPAPESVYRNRQSNVQLLHCVLTVRELGV